MLLIISHLTGFGDGHSGLVIGLHSIDDSSAVPIPEPEEHEKQLEAEPEPGLANDKPSSLPEPELKPKGTSISTTIPTVTLVLLLTALTVLL